MNKLHPKSIGNGVHGVEFSVTEFAHALYYSWRRDVQIREAALRGKSHPIPRNINFGSVHDLWNPKTIEAMKETPWWDTMQAEFEKQFADIATGNDAIGIEDMLGLCVRHEQVSAVKRE